MLGLESFVIYNYWFDKRSGQLQFKEWQQEFVVQFAHWPTVFYEIDVWLSSSQFSRTIF